MASKSVARKALIQPRFMRAGEAPEYLSMNLALFNEIVRPYVSEFPLGERGVGFDRPSAATVQPFGMTTIISHPQYRPGKPRSVPIPGATPRPARLESLTGRRPSPKPPPGRPRPRRPSAANIP